MALVAEASEPASDGLLDVGALCRMFEESEDSSYQSRKDSERDRDYVDGKQHTAAELAELEKRGQPAVVDNRIKTKVDYLVGLEKQQRVKPKAFPRTPKHEADADGATEALRYVSEEQDYEAKRSGVWRNILVEGAGGIRVYVDQDYNGELCVKLQRVSWDRLFFDPHSAEPDFSDAGYFGIVTWMDYDDAAAMYPDRRDELDVTLQSAPSDTYDDKPKFSHWADKKRKRVRICQIFIKRAEQWFFAEYTKGGILKSGPSPYVTDKGESDCELILQSAYVDRDNNRYGLVREMISLQDEINKRRSKSLHLINTSQVVYEEGAVPDINEFHKESQLPNGRMLVNPGALAEKRIEFRTRDDLATAHFQLLQEAKNAIDLKGPNATEMGDKAGAGGSSSASGKAIIASQQGGMIQIGDLMDSLRHLDKRTFRAVWARIRQFWTAEKWVRVTDDERNVKWLGLNLDPQKIAMAQAAAQQNPQVAAQMEQQIAGMVGPIAELDCDIIIDDAPDSLTPQLEQFQALVELKKFDANNEVPFRAIVKAMPNLKDKEAFLSAMDEQMQMRQQQPNPEAAKAMAQVQAKQQEHQQTLAFNAQAHAQAMQQKQDEAMLNAAVKMREVEHEDMRERQKMARDAEAEEVRLTIQLDGEAKKADLQRGLEREKAALALSTEREKAQTARDTEVHKATLSRDSEREKASIASTQRREQADSDRERSERETKAKTEASKPMDQSAINAITDLGKKIDDLASNIETVVEKVAMPKKLVRDKSGEIIGAEPVNSLPKEARA